MTKSDLLELLKPYNNDAVVVFEEPDERGNVDFYPLDINEYRDNEGNLNLGAVHLIVES